MSLCDNFFMEIYVYATMKKGGRKEGMSLYIKKTMNKAVSKDNCLIDLIPKCTNKIFFIISIFFEDKFVPICFLLKLNLAIH